MTIIARTVQLAAGAALAASALPASADVFELDWGYRWSIGTIAHTTDVVDSDPAPFRAVYENAILDYRFDAFDVFDYYLFEGRGGRLIIDGQDPGCLNIETCQPRTFTFEFGQARAFAGDTANYTLTVRFPWAEPWQSHALRFDEEWTAPLNGFITNDGGVVPGLGAMGEYWATRHYRVAAPVPEPETWALLAMGSGLVAWGARRRSRALPAQPV